MRRQRGTSTISRFKTSPLSVGKELLKRMDKPSRKQELHEWLNKEIAREIESSGACDVPALVNRAAEHFEKKASFMKELVAEILRPAAYQSARQIIKTTRKEEAVELGGEVVARSEFEQRAQSRFERWIENIERGRDVRVLDMSKEDCVEARRNRLQRADHESELADLFGTLGAGLKKSQKVGDVFTADEIEAIYQRIKDNRGEAA